VILFVAFGSLLAMGLPIATALLAVGCGMAAVQLAAQVDGHPAVRTGAVAMIALGAGINYALFIVTRYREELADGLPPERGGRTGDGDGRTRRVLRRRDRGHVAVRAADRRDQRRPFAGAWRSSPACCS
jgi:hypothetical protein